MKKILFSGLAADIDETRIRASLEKLGPVIAVNIIRDGDAAAPLVLVEMDIDDETAYRLTARVTDFWHDGQTINARLLLH